MTSGYTRAIRYTGDPEYRHLTGWVALTSILKGLRLFTIKESYTPAEAKRANGELDGLISSKEITSRKAGTYRRQIAERVRIALKQSYTSQAAKRAKTEIMKLVEAGIIPAMSARAYRAHVTKRTLAA